MRLCVTRLLFLIYLSSLSSSSLSADSLSVKVVGPLRANADMSFAAVTGGPEQPSASVPGSPSSGEEAGEGQAQPTQAADAAREDEGDPTQRMSPPIPIDQLVHSLCGESTDGASP